MRLDGVVVPEVVREDGRDHRVLSIKDALAARAAVAASTTQVKRYVSPTAFAKSVINDPLYRARVKASAIRGTLDPRIEVLLWHYAEGKPTVRLELGRPGAFGAPDLDTLSNTELVERAKAIAGLLEGGVESEDAADAQPLESDPG